MFKNKRICIDFGHGGSDPGAIGLMGILEKDLTLEIGNILVLKLKSKGVNVVITRDRDSYVNLKSRCDISNNSEASLFISLHFNAFTNAIAKGIEVYNHPGSSKGKEFAQIILKDIIDADLYTQNRGVKTSSKLYVLKRTKAPAVLVEFGFITNHEDLELIQRNKYNFANVLSNSIIKCLQKV